MDTNNFKFQQFREGHYLRAKKFSIKYGFSFKPWLILRMEKWKKVVYEQGLF